MKKNEKEQQEFERRATILVDVLKKYLLSETLVIPEELRTYIEIIEIPNIIIDIYKITYIKLQKKESWYNDKALIFTKHIKHQQQLDYDYSKDLIPIEKVIGSIDYIDDTLLLHTKNKRLNEHSFLRLISQTRYVPIKKDCYIDIDTRESILESTLLAADKDDYKDFKIFDKNKVSYVYSADIPSGLIIRYKDEADKPSLLLKFNLFDKRDVIFKGLKINFIASEINTTIQHLQTIIPNINDLIFLSNLVKHHYFDPFEKTHRRLHIILYGGQGTGKTLLTGRIANLFNSKVVNFRYSKNDNFIYIELKGAAFVVMNEYKKTSESANFIKRISDTDIITINDKHEKKYDYPFYAMFISCCNPSHKNPISNLVEERDNRNYPIEMDINGVDTTFKYIADNTQLVQTTLFYIALKYKLEIVEMGRLTQQRTQTINLETINFIGFWDYLLSELEKQSDTQLNISNADDYSVAISNDVFKKYISNQKEYLLKRDENFKYILQLQNKLKTNTSAVKTIIKEKDNFLISEPIKSSRCYTITKGLANVINMKNFEDIEYNTQQITITKKEFLSLQNELDKFLVKRKKNFEYQYN